LNLIRPRIFPVAQEQRAGNESTDLAHLLLKPIRGVLIAAG